MSFCSFPPPREAVVLPSAIFAKKTCVFSIRMTGALLHLACNGQAPPGCRSGRYGFRVFGAQESVPRDRCSVGTRHTLFLSLFSKHPSSVLVRTALCHEVRNPGPKKKPKSSAAKTTICQEPKKNPKTQKSRSSGVLDVTVFNLAWQFCTSDHPASG